jgi:hypothetical protein
VLDSPRHGWLRGSRDLSSIANMPTVEAPATKPDDIETLERLTLLRVNSGVYRNLGKYVLNLPAALASHGFGSAPTGRPLVQLNRDR